MAKTGFNVRVYGIFINHRGEVLVSDEYRFGRYFTKFPGGGLEFGEGTVECLKRESMEEIGQVVNVTQHLYTTDFFQPSAFDPTDQIISIYYAADLSSPGSLITKTKRFDFDEKGDDLQSFRWVLLATMTQEELDFPIDKKVLQQLKPQFI
jgi:8-oxo-dGTP diphosphatase